MQMKRYLINLDRSSERLAHVTLSFHQCGLTFERIPAVDGTAMSDDACRQLTAGSTYRRELARAEIGCFLSHRHCLGLIAQGDAPWGAVFEDDIVLSPNVALFLRNSDWIPAGTDMVKLDTNNSLCLIGKSRHALPAGHQLARLVSRHLCTGGYLISKTCAAALYALTESIHMPIDEVYYNSDYGQLRHFNIQQMVPALVVQTGHDSTLISQRQQLANLPRTLPQKTIRELRRIHSKHLWPLWRMLTRGEIWGRIHFG